MSVVIQLADQSVGDESTRRMSTFYVPLSTEDLTMRDGDHEQIFSSDYSCDWSLNDSVEGSEMKPQRAEPQVINVESNRVKRYGIVLNGSVNIDDSNLEVYANHKRTKSKNMASSTPIKDSPQPKQAESPFETNASYVKEKSKTLPVRELPAAATFPPKNSFILKSTPRMSLTYSPISETSALIQNERKSNASPKKSLSFIRRTHSTRLSRNNSLLKLLTTKCVAHSNESLSVNVYDLSIEWLALYLKAPNCDDLMKDLFFRELLDMSSSDSCGNTYKVHDEDDNALSGKRMRRRLGLGC